MPTSASSVPSAWWRSAITKGHLVAKRRMRSRIWGSFDLRRKLARVAVMYRSEYWRCPMMVSYPTPKDDATWLNLLRCRSVNGEAAG